MTRRSWRDLEPPEGPAERAGLEAPLRGAGGPDDLRRAAAMAPGSRLTALLDQREALERRIRALSGGGDSRDPSVADRFPVASFAERRAEQQAFEARQERRRRAQDDLRGAGRSQESAPSGMSGLPDTPLAQRMRTGLPALDGTGLAGARSALGAGGAVGALRERFVGASRSRRAAILGPARRAGAALEEAGRPLREFGRQLDTARGQMDDLDRRLASEGVGEAERSEIRRSVGGDTLDKVGGVVARADAALAKPKRLVDGVANRWAARERQLTAPMDQVSHYARTRDRRLSTETGGSGDLFERMARNRQRALERRREARREEERDRQRRERAAKRGAARRDEAGGDGRGAR